MTFYSFITLIELFDVYLELKALVIWLIEKSITFKIFELLWLKVLPFGDRLDVPFFALLLSTLLFWPNLVMWSKFVKLAFDPFNFALSLLIIRRSLTKSPVVLSLCPFWIDLGDVCPVTIFSIFSFTFRLNLFSTLEFWLDNCFCEFWLFRPALRVRFPFSVDLLFFV